MRTERGWIGVPAAYNSTGWKAVGLLARLDVCICDCDAKLKQTDRCGSRSSGCRFRTVPIVVVRDVMLGR